METFFIIGFGVLISFILVCIIQYIGEDMGDMFFDGFYGSTSMGEKLRDKEQFKKK